MNAPSIYEHADLMLWIIVGLLGLIGILFGVIGRLMIVGLQKVIANAEAFELRVNAEIKSIYCRIEDMEKDVHNRVNEVSTDLGIVRGELNRIKR